ncbi:uncharacterized protein M421DRAFT_93072 [Didymella exigua CBS 183.55]|uniref:Uncharacterized protein n=1 Tax=Didymella exigua CBS 183.55 TaxID=1150837 RepID=A0A6A5RMV5_9PLEO|nr:uncharacterized protein M421DRAFT_93072 [Didymella exigua CBS 183.55]KAF1927686.1 hypothetical protein M421DRAFT_93072 [Didymella exigua CBS 183.55]
MLFSGAFGALVMYSILRSRDEHRRHSHGRQAYEQKPTGHEAIPQSAQHTTAQRGARQQVETCSPESPEQPTSQTPGPPRVAYVPREVIREVVVDCSCKCACKAPEKPDLQRSFWSLDQGTFVAAARDKEAKKIQEKRREEVGVFRVVIGLEHLHSELISREEPDDIAMR